MTKEFYILVVDGDTESPGKDFLDIGWEEAVAKCGKNGSYTWKKYGMNATLNSYEFSTEEDMNTAKDMAEEFADILNNNDGHG